MEGQRGKSWIDRVNRGPAKKRRKIGNTTGAEEMSGGLGWTEEVENSLRTCEDLRTSLIPSSGEGEAEDSLRTCEVPQTFLTPSSDDVTNRSRYKAI
ncbi:hypothetical protein WN48_08348 [Eufriesea mexicana]|uniref:Uncharacterized protein n=1 Tax=Eufriesea mexicana TaxID=516756 RepID=A0A310STG3_9HYME|nr:hypothetical protein WN48_08348 [Eufriesea mexicana]